MATRNVYLSEPERRRHGTRTRRPKPRAAGADVPPVSLYTLSLQVVTWFFMECTVPVSQCTFAIRLGSWPDLSTAAERAPRRVSGSAPTHQCGEWAVV